MAVNLVVRRVDAKETIKSLRQLEPEAAKEFKRGVAAVVAPTIADARSQYPALPLSGMARSWSGGFPWVQASVGRGLKPKVSTRRQGNSVIYISQTSKAGTAFELGKADHGRLGPQIRQRYGRVLWPAYDRNAAQIEAGISDLIKRAEQTIYAMVH